MVDRYLTRGRLGEGRGGGDTEQGIAWWDGDLSKRVIDVQLQDWVVGGVWIKDEGGWERERAGRGTNEVRAEMTRGRGEIIISCVPGGQLSLFYSGGCLVLSFLSRERVVGWLVA